MKLTAKEQKEITRCNLELLATNLEIYRMALKFGMTENDIAIFSNLVIDKKRAFDRSNEIYDAVIAREEAGGK